MPWLTSVDKCVGCTACVSICRTGCLQMRRDDMGFGYPQLIDEEQCINCGQCERVCPTAEVNSGDGTFAKSYAAYSLNENIQNNSSSGGIFTELALIVLQQDGIVYGAAYDEHWRVKHIAVNRMEDLHKLQGAKYSESFLGDTFKEIQEHLKRKKLILFSGTSCQVAGLKSYIDGEYNNLICIDFVCHGIPAPMVWEKYIEMKKKTAGHEKMPIRINQRSKETGWSRYTYSCLIEYDDGTCDSVLNTNDLYMKLFCNDYILRRACSQCQFKGYDRVSDITLGDFWGIWDLEPDMDNGKGTSLVLIHSKLGMTLFAIISSKIKFKECSLSAASKENPSILYPSSEKPEKKIVFEKVKNNEFTTLNQLFECDEEEQLHMLKGILAKIKGRVQKSR